MGASSTTIAVVLAYERYIPLSRNENNARGQLLGLVTTHPKRNHVVVACWSLWIELCPDVLRDRKSRFL